MQMMDCYVTLKFSESTDTGPQFTSIALKQDPAADRTRLVRPAASECAFPKYELSFKVNDSNMSRIHNLLNLRYIAVYMMLLLYRNSSR